MKFLAIESLRISLKLNISAAREQQAVGLGLFNVVASWVMACEYLSLGLHVGNHSRPTPLTIIFYFCLSPRRMGCRAWAWFLPRFPVIFFPYGVFFGRFFLAPVQPLCLVSGCPALVIFLAAIGGT